MYDLPKVSVNATEGSPWHWPLDIVISWSAEWSLQFICFLFVLGSSCNFRAKGWSRAVLSGKLFEHMGLHPLPCPFYQKQQVGRKKVSNEKENLRHLWVMPPRSGTVVITVAALADSFHLSEAGIAGKYSRHLSLEPESIYPSWHLSLVELRAGF